MQLLWLLLHYLHELHWFEDISYTKTAWFLVSILDFLPTVWIFFRFVDGIRPILKWCFRWKGSFSWCPAAEIVSVACAWNGHHFKGIIINQSLIFKSSTRKDYCLCRLFNWFVLFLLEIYWIVVVISVHYIMAWLKILLGCICVLFLWVNVKAILIVWLFWKSCLSTEKPCWRTCKVLWGNLVSFLFKDFLNYYLVLFPGILSFIVMFWYIPFINWRF